MIAEAAPVAAYMALTVTLPALVLGHQGEAFPPWRWWRWARATWARRGAWQGPGAPQSPFRDSRGAGAPAGSPERRTAPRVPSWAHQQPIETEEAA